MIRKSPISSVGDILSLAEKTGKTTKRPFSVTLPLYTTKQAIDLCVVLTKHKITIKTSEFTSDGLLLSFSSEDDAVMAKLTSPPIK